MLWSLASISDGSSSERCAHKWEKTLFFEEKSQIDDYCRCMHMPYTDQNIYFTQNIRIVLWATIENKHHALFIYLGNI